MMSFPDVDFRGVVSKRRIRYEPMGVVAGINPWNGPWGSGLQQARAGARLGKHAHPQAVA